ncbi:ABC transporter [Edaphobacter flagellatus]|uniref:ABC transporter n=1 Tax=Edaphobacter flagellatus TaxID=1933044 RepID=UPI0021B3D669|nr:ABC transporter [Edaphobacter flagellatus]
MRYQLVLQFCASSKEDFDDLVALEKLLVDKLPLDAEVDGHDFGCDEFNIFVLTAYPKETFNAAETIILQQGLQQQVRAAYRELNNDDFVLLWPPNLREFKVV